MKLPSISGRQCVNVLTGAGFTIVRQKGSHIIMRKNDPFHQLVAPDHKEPDRGTLRAIIRQSGISQEEFIQRLKNI
jgi:predicted RNA binding protein YcfA (HicA-like mRNA interferase family)